MNKEQAIHFHFVLNSGIYFLWLYSVIYPGKKKIWSFVRPIVGYVYKPTTLEWSSPPNKDGIDAKRREEGGLFVHEVSISNGIKAF